MKEGSGRVLQYGELSWNALSGGMVHSKDDILNKERLSTY
jgi:hypothetical protein